MSCFSVMRHGNHAFKNHSSLGKFITGEVFSELIFKHAIKDSKLNSYFRDNVADKFCLWATPKVLPARKPIATKVLKTTLNTEKLAFIKQRLMEKYAESSSMQLARLGKEVLSLGLRNLSSRVFNGTQKEVEKSLIIVADEEQDKDYNQKIMKCLKERKFSEAALAYAESKLMPVCEEAVQKALLAMTKGAAKKAYDVTIKKTCSMVVMPMMYGAFLFAMNSLSTYSQIPLETYTDYFPRPIWVLTLGGGYNLLTLIKQVWVESRKHAGTVDLDKEDVKKFAFDNVRNDMSKKIKENELLTNLEMNQTDESVDQIIKIFISEIVDFYWQDLHETKILRLPLVA